MLDRTLNAVVAGSSPARLTIPFNKIQLVSTDFLVETLHLTWQCFCLSLPFRPQCFFESTLRAVPASVSI